MPSLASSHLASLQLGEIRPRANQHGSVYWDADGHHLREGLPDRLSDCLSLESGGKFLLLPAPPAKMWLQLLDHMASLEQFVPREQTRMLLLQWWLENHWSAALNDAAMPVPLSTGCNQCISSWLGGERWTLGIPPSGAPPYLLLYTYMLMIG